MSTFFVTADCLQGLSFMGRVQSPTNDLVQVDTSKEETSEILEKNVWQARSSAQHRLHIKFRRKFEFIFIIYYVIQKNNK